MAMSMPGFLKETITPTRTIGSGRASRSALLVLVALALPLLAYAAVRASAMSFTYDECYTFMEHVRKSRFYQDSFDQMGGNHHLLNVWLMWACWKLFGAGELALRVPNLLAYAAYLTASIGIAIRMRSAILALGVFLVLNLHPYLIDFFSLARGYGLSSAFMMLSLWQATIHVDGSRARRPLLLSALFAGLSAMSHIIMVNYLLAFAATMALMAFFTHRGRLAAARQELFIIAATTVAALLLILPAALGLFHGGSLNFGCADLWSCSMRSLAEKILYHIDYGRAPLVLVEKALWWGAGGCAFSALLVLWKGAAVRLRPFVLGLSILALCLISFLLQQLLFGVPLPETRTALFLLPLAAFVVVSALGAWPGPALLPAIALIAGSVPLGIHCSHAFNTEYAVEWKSTGSLRTALERIAADRLEVTSARPITTTRVSFGVAGCMPYYITSRDWDWLTYGLRSDTAFQPADYYILEYDSHQLIDHEHWDELFRSDVTGLRAYRDARSHHSFPVAVYDAEESIPADAERAGMSWVVPPETHPMPVLILGASRGFEVNSDNWQGLILEVWRQGRLIASESQPSHRQNLAYGEWESSYIETFMPDSLYPNDSIRFRSIPCFADPPVRISQLRLSVMQ